MKLYHYTTQKSFNQIEIDQLIKASEGKFGKGIYFTELSPKNGFRNLIKNNYNKIRGNNMEKTERCFVFDMNLSSDCPFFRRVLNDKNTWICQLDNGLPVHSVCAIDVATGRSMEFDRKANKFL